MSGGEDGGLHQTITVAVFVMGEFVFSNGAHEIHVWKLCYSMA